jgi:CHAT domain-containing protein
VTRFTRLPIPAIPWPQDRPLRLLFTGASPATMPRLDTAAEWAGVERALAPLAAAGRIEAKAIAQGATLADLLAALRRGVDLWHFAGHGAADGIYFTGARGQEMLVEAETLGQLLAGEGVRLAVLNACRAGAGGGQAASVAGALLRADVPAVVAMQADVSDATADAFAAAFYDAIAVGQGVDRAVTAARKAILATKSSAQWWIPALFMRTPEGRIWQEPEQGAATQTIVQFTGDRNTVITGRVGGNVDIRQ